MSQTINKAFSLDFPQHKRAQITNIDGDVLEVIGAGLPRSGTTSLKAALEILSFDPCHHMVECVEHPDRSLGFTSLLQSQRFTPSPSRDTKLKKLMRGYRATVDTPGCEVYTDLMRLYPSAKVILSVRDSDEAWWKSFDGALGGILTLKYRILTFPIRFLRLQRDLVDAIVARWASLPGVTEDLGPAVHAAHNAQVRATVPKERLLEFNVKMGWPKLCEFLEVEVPDQPFPNLNDAKTIKKAVTGGQVFGACIWLLGLGFAAGTLVLLFRPESVLQYFRS